MTEYGRVVTTAAGGIPQKADYDRVIDNYLKTREKTFPKFTGEVRIVSSGYGMPFYSALGWYADVPEEYVVKPARTSEHQVNLYRAEIDDLTARLDKVAALCRQYQAQAETTPLGLAHHILETLQ